MNRTRKRGLIYPAFNVKDGGDTWTLFRQDAPGIVRTIVVIPEGLGAEEYVRSVAHEMNNTVRSGS